ncbi:alpha/beta hydrolase [Nocardioides hungaricus]
MLVRTGAARLAVETRGAGPPDVLLLHAGVTDQRSWAALAGRLAPSARCVSFDRRGYGRTEYDAQPGWSAVEDAVAVLDAVGIGRAVVVGASMGGRTAIDLALAHPDRVAALVLVGAAVRGAPEPELDGPTETLDRALDAAAEAGDLATVNRLEARVWLDGPHQPEGRVGGAARELFLAMNEVALAAPDPGEEAVLPDAWPRLAEIAVPALVLVGEHDLRHVRGVARHLAATLPSARLVELPGVAHLPHLEADEATLAEIDRFVRRAGAGVIGRSGRVGE